MALSLSDLQRWRDDLVSTRLGGLRVVQDRTGERVEYKTDAEMARAIASADRLIATLQAGAPATTILFLTSKGV